MIVCILANACSVSACQQKRNEAHAVSVLHFTFGLIIHGGEATAMGQQTDELLQLTWNRRRECSGHWRDMFQTQLWLHMR